MGLALDRVELTIDAQAGLQMATNELDLACERYAVMTAALLSPLVAIRSVISKCSRP